MNTLLALMLGYSCVGYGLIEVGIRGNINSELEAKNTMIWLTDVIFPVPEEHIEMVYLKRGDSSENTDLKVHVRNPEKEEEFFQLDTTGSTGKVTFVYKGVRMTDQKVSCELDL